MLYKCGICNTYQRIPCGLYMHGMTMLIPQSFSRITIHFLYATIYPGDMAEKFFEPHTLQQLYLCSILIVCLLENFQLDIDLPYIYFCVANL